MKEQMELFPETHGKNVRKDEGKSAFSTAEKAQYEVFTNGTIPRETLEKWIRNDLRAVASFAHACLHEPLIFDAIVDRFYSRYVNFHKKEDVDKS